LEFRVQSLIQVIRFLHLVLRGGGAAYNWVLEPWLMKAQATLLFGRDHGKDHELSIHIHGARAIVGPCHHRDRDYCIGSNFWKFYLIRTNLRLGEPVSLVKVFRPFRLERMFFGVRSVDRVRRCTTYYLLAGPACLWCLVPSVNYKPILCGHIIHGILILRLILVLIFKRTQLAW